MKHASVAPDRSGMKLASCAALLLSQEELWKRLRKKQGWYQDKTRQKLAKNPDISLIICMKNILSRFSIGIAPHLRACFVMLCGSPAWQEEQDRRSFVWSEHAILLKGCNSTRSVTRRPTHKRCGTPDQKEFFA